MSLDNVFPASKDAYFSWKKKKTFPKINLRPNTGYMYVSKILKNTLPIVGYVLPIVESYKVEKRR